ncbi:MAG: iron ABC transporter permease [Alphaproteobacteria bacterium GM7ARS4]|nr:iron ABC transporter permease [Alphaproteobacteria bacterium GM7ARS4]
MDGVPLRQRNGYGRRIVPMVLSVLPSVVVWGMALVVLCPLLMVVSVAWTGHDDVWVHVVEHTLLDYTVATLTLVVGVAVGSTLLGVGTAWCVTMYRFPLSRLLRSVLLLPMAMPSYLVAFVYTDLFEGRVFFDVRSMGMAIFVMSVTLYPYVYAFVRASLIEQSACMWEAGRILGCRPWRNFFSVAFPLMRPSLIAGLSLVMMETLNDFGTVQYFAIPSFTSGIYNTWLNMNSLGAAARLSVLLLLFIIVVLSMEWHGRGEKRYHHMTTRHRFFSTDRVSGWRGYALMGVCLFPLVVGFLVPCVVLAMFAWSSYPQAFADNMFVPMVNSLTLATLGSVLVVILGFLLAWAGRPPSGLFFRALMRMASVGYAIPGAVLGVGILLWLSFLERDVSVWLFGAGSGSLYLLSSSWALLYGYSVRFLALSYGAVESSLSRVTLSMEQAARTLGATAWRVMMRVHVPMVRPSVITAALLVFVDIMKELPLTLLLRPPSYETLATWVWLYAQDEAFVTSSAGALMIVMIGLLPVLWMSRLITRSVFGGHEGYGSAPA